MTRVKRSKIVYTLFFVLIAVGTIPLVLSGWLQLSDSRDRLELTQREVQIQIAQGVASEISSYLESNRLQLSSMVDVVALSVAGSKLEDVESRRELQQYLEKMLGINPDFLNFELIARSGQPLHVGARVDDPTVQAGMAAMAARALSTSGTVHVSSPRYLRERDITVILLGNAVVLGGRAEGALIATLNLQPVQDIVQRRSVYSNTLILTDNNVAPFMQQSGQAPLDAAGFQKSEIGQRMADLRNQIVTSLRYVDQQDGKDVPKLGSITRVKNVGWGVLVEARRDEFLSPVNEMIRNTILFGIVAIVIAGVLALLSARRISSPINALAQASRSIAQGNFGERVQIKSGNEIGEFAENFNAMADRIEDDILQLKSAAEHNRQLFLESIQTLSAAIDEKDPYTRGHSERVTRYSVIIGEQLGLAAEDLERLRVAALLHDVGKIGIDDGILRKPGMLTPEEFEIMKQHPEKGFNIVRKISLLKDHISGIKHHHERMDGAGYPNGLRGEEISMQARIISVADTFDAMTTRRPYQEPMTLEFVLERIKSFVGSRYDDRVVSALVHVVESGRIKVRPKVYVDAVES
ncbi:MAG: HD domain-containing phosphohydrolase [Acidobacteriota bacterium]